MSRDAILHEIADLLRARHVAKDVMGAEAAAAYLDVGLTFFREMVALYKIPFVPLKGARGRGRVVYRNGR